MAHWRRARSVDARHHHGPRVVIDPKTGRVVTSGSSTPGPAGTTYVQLDPATGRIVGLRSSGPPQRRFFAFLGAGRHRSGAARGLNRRWAGGPVSV